MLATNTVRTAVRTCDSALHCARPKYNRTSIDTQGSVFFQLSTHGGPAGRPRTGFMRAIAMSQQIQLGANPESVGVILIWAAVELPLELLGNVAIVAISVSVWRWIVGKLYLRAYANDVNHWHVTRVMGRLIRRQMVRWMRAIAKPVCVTLLCRSLAMQILMAKSMARTSTY